MSPLFGRSGDIAFIQARNTACKAMQMLSAIVYPRISPVIFRLGPIAPRWYGMAYLIGFLLAFMLLRKLVRSGVLRISRNELADLMGWLMVGVIVGGRAGWWLFYHRTEGAVEPWYEALALWHGGMSFHGGLIGVVIALAAFARRREVAFLNLADCAALVAPLGLFFGRLANFVNAELVGRSTSVPWGVIFPGETFPRHPSQVYEALLEGPLLFVILWLVWARWRPIEGRTAALFLVTYGLLRFLVEFTRQPDVQIGYVAFGWLTMGQLLSAALSATGIAVWLCAGRSVKTSPMGLRLYHCQ